MNTRRASLKLQALCRPCASSSPEERARIPISAPDALKQIGINEPQWLIQARAIESRYWRAVSSADSLARLAATLVQKWVRSLAGAEELERLS